MTKSVIKLNPKICLMVAVKKIASYQLAQKIIYSDDTLVNSKREGNFLVH